MTTRRDELVKEWTLRTHPAARHTERDARAASESEADPAVMALCQGDERGRDMQDSATQAVDSSNLPTIRQSRNRITVPPSRSASQRCRPAIDTVSERDDTGRAARSDRRPVGQSRELTRSSHMSRMTKSGCRSEGRQTPLELKASCHRQLPGAVRCQCGCIHPLQGISLATCFSVSKEAQRAPGASLQLLRLPNGTEPFMRREPHDKSVQRRSRA